VQPNPIFAAYYERDVLTAAPAIGLKIQILKAGTDREIDAAFVSLVQARPGALLVGADVFFNNRIEQIVERIDRFGYIIHTTCKYAKVKRPMIIQLTDNNTILITNPENY
jgi:hypothetical protein